MYLLPYFELCQEKRHYCTESYYLDSCTVDNQENLREISWIRKIYISIILNILLDKIHIYIRSIDLWPNNILDNFSYLMLAVRKITSYTK